MRRMVAIMIIMSFILISIPAFAEIKRLEKSPFNVLSEWLSSFGKRADGTSIMHTKPIPSTLSDEEVKARRLSIGGVIRGMGRYNREAERYEGAK